MLNIMEMIETIKAAAAMMSDREMTLAVSALCVATASMVWSMILLVRVAVDYYGFRRRSSSYSTNVHGVARSIGGAAEE